MKKFIILCAIFCTVIMVSCATFTEDVIDDTMLPETSSVIPLDTVEEMIEPTSEESYEYFEYKVDDVGAFETVILEESVVEVGGLYRFTITPMPPVIEVGSSEFAVDRLPASIEVYSLDEEKVIATMDVQVEPKEDVWGKVDIVDANFDGYKDIVIHTYITTRTSIYYEYIYLCFLWDIDKKTYSTEAIELPGNAVIDVSMKLIHANYTAGAGIHGVNIYKFQDNEFVCTNRLTIYHSKDGDIDKNILEEGTLIDGEWEYSEVPFEYDRDTNVAKYPLSKLKHGELWDKVLE